MRILDSRSELYVCFISIHLDDDDDDVEIPPMSLL